MMLFAEGVPPLAASRLVLGVAVIGLSLWAWLRYYQRLRQVLTAPAGAPPHIRWIAWQPLVRESIRLVKETLLLLVAFSGNLTMLLDDLGVDAVTVADWRNLAYAAFLAVLALFAVTTIWDMVADYMVEHEP